MKKDSKTSSCWNYFEKLEGGARCKICSRFIASFGNTSNLVKHLRRLHKDIFTSGVIKNKRNHNEETDHDETQAEGTAASEEEPGDTVAETNSAVHTIQAYRDVNGTTFLYLHPSTEGEGNVQLANAQFQPVVASSESITTNGEIVSVAVQNDTHEGQAVDGDAKTQEEVTPRRVIHAPVKNFQGSTLAGKAVVRQLTRPSPIKTAPPSKSNNNNNNSNIEDSYEAFGKYIASMLRTLPSKSALKLQGEIVNWILREKMKS